MRVLSCTPTQDVCAGLALTLCFLSGRAISVMLGETWKGLPQEERERFTQQARILAEEKKRLYPDCWKRKRSVSAS